MVSSYTLSLLIGIGVCLVFSAFFAMSEAGLLSANRTRLRYLSDRGDEKAQVALLLLQRPRRMLATVLIGNNIVNTLASVMAAALTIRIWGDFGLGIAAGVITFLLLLIGEITPKSFATEHSEWVARHVARPILLLNYLFLPVERALSGMAKGILRLTGTARVSAAQFHTEEEIKALLHIGKERGHIDEIEAEIIRAVFTFNDLELRDIMKPRPEVFFVRSDDPLSRVSQLVGRSGHSRFPVLDGEKPVGLVYAKDLLIMDAAKLSELTVGGLTRSISVFRPEFHVGSAMKKMQGEASQMGAIVDGEGRLLGIVTVEDLLEQIVGEITDEYEHARRKIAGDRAKIESGKPLHERKGAAAESP